MLTKRRIASSLVAAFAVQSALLPTFPAAAAAARPACREIAVSPAFAKDHSALCSQLITAGTMALSLYRTRDGGRSWSKVAAKGLAFDATTPFQVQPQFSPRFATDHRVVVTTNTGMYATTDLGDSFALVDARTQSGGLDNPVLYAGAPGTLAPAFGSHPTFSVVAGLQPARVGLGTSIHQPVLGVPGGTVEFIVPTSAAPSAPVLAMSSEHPDQTSSAVVRVLWGCTDDLTCTERRYAFAPDVIPTRFWRLPLTGHRSSLAVVAGHKSETQAFLSDDNGMTFRRWSSLEKLIAPVATHGGVEGVNLAYDTALPGRVYARIIGATRVKWDKTAPPREQVFRSDNGGATWRRVGYQLDIRQAGRRGNLPWNTTAFGYTEDVASFALTPDGRLLVPAAITGASGMVPGSASVYCSLDGGATWRSLCAH